MANSNKINQCLNGIKQCLKPSKSKDYEYVSYDQQNKTPEQQRNIQSNDNAIRTSQFKIQFNEIEPSNELKKQYANANLINGNLLFSKPKFHSTQIESSTESSLYLSVLTDNNYNYKKSSTLINSNDDQSIISDDLTTTQIKSNDYNVTDDLSTSQYKTKMYTSDSNSLYFSPIINRNKSAVMNSSNDSTTTSSSYYTDDESTFDTTQNHSYTSDDFQTVRSSFFDQQQSDNNQMKDNYDQLYVCIVPYSAKLQGDLNLNYSERVQLIHSNNDYCLVYNIVTKQCGYVPRTCITLLSSFLKQL